MAGNFINSKYKADDGRVFRIRIAPATELLAFGTQQNAPTVNALSEPEGLTVRKDLIERGLKTRKVVLRWIDVVPIGYVTNSLLSVVILTPEIFNAIQLDQQCTYRGANAIVVSKKRERT